MTGELRGNRQTGYRTTQPIECPHCTRAVALAATATSDKQGPHLLIWAVVPKAGGYSEEDINRITRHEGLTAAQTGVQLPAKLRGTTKLPADPVPF